MKLDQLKSAAEQDTPKGIFICTAKLDTLCTGLGFMVGADKGECVLCRDERKRRPAKPWWLE